MTNKILIRIVMLALIILTIIGTYRDPRLALLLVVEGFVLGWLFDNEKGLKTG